LHALTRVRERHPDVRLIILGEGEQRAALEALSAQLHLTANVVFKGAVSTVFDELKNADVFVLASRFEGFGNVFCEAMALGVPVIAAEGTIAEAYVANMITGTLIPPDDAATTASAVVSLLTNEEQRAAIGAAGRQRVAREFPEQEMVDGFEKAATAAGGRHRR
jgi:glycosyltransferase involved in cell wall biosynthesis